jgi:hypothetical protein
MLTAIPLPGAIMGELYGAGEKLFKHVDLKGLDRLPFEGISAKSGYPCATAARMRLYRVD